MGRQEVLVNFQQRTAGENHRSFNHILQFTDVSRPGVVNDSLERVRINGFGGPFQLAPKLSDKVLSQEGDVLGTIAKGRNGNGKDRETIKQIGPEVPLGERR